MLIFASFSPLPLILRCVFFWPLYHHHLCQCRAGSDRKPDTSLPVYMPPKLHSTGLPFTAAVHHRAASVHRQPLPHRLCPQIFPLEGRSAEHVLRCLYGGEYSRDKTSNMTANQITAILSSSSVVLMF